jgi:protein SCO1
MHCTSRARRASRWGITKVARRCLPLLVAAALTACDLDHGFHGVAVLPPRELPAIAFTRADGSSYSLSPADDELLVLSFGYTHCPDVCPTTLADWKRVKQGLGRDSARVRFVFVTVDPERDTPELADRYAKQFDPSFVGLSGDSATTAQALHAFEAMAVKDPSVTSSGYLVSHSSQVFLVDGRGRLIALYAFGSGWDALLADLEALL